LSQVSTVSIGILRRVSPIGPDTPSVRFPTDADSFEPRRTRRLGRRRTQRLRRRRAV